MLLSFDKVDGFVQQQEKLGSKVRWDGWTIVYFSPSSRAVYSPSGRYHNGEWGFETRISPNETGKWSVPKKFVRFNRRPRSRRR